MREWLWWDEPEFFEFERRRVRIGQGLFTFRRAVADCFQSPCLRSAFHGYIPILVTDACGAGNEDAAKRSIESLKLAGDALIMDAETVSGVLRRQRGVGST
jgi:hypothetical protein